MPLSLFGFISPQRAFYVAVARWLTARRTLFPDSDHTSFEIKTLPSQTRRRPTRIPRHNQRFRSFAHQSTCLCKKRKLTAVNAPRTLSRGDCEALKRENAFDRTSYSLTPRVQSQSAIPYST